jgi:cyclohexanecarboxylate-CoA ligase/acyl-CoA synthetase
MLEIRPEERERYESLGLWSAAESLANLLARNARTRPDATAVVDNHGRRLTYRELDEQASALATALAARGAGAGTVIGMQLPNRVESSVVVAAIEKLGAITLPLTPMFRERELRYVVERADMGMLVVPGTFRRHDYEAMALAVRAQAPALGHIVSLADSPAAGIDPFAALLTEGATAHDGRYHDPPIDPNAPAAILLTSGTESDPKAVIHTNNTLQANTRALQRMLELTDADHIFMASPVGHGTGFGFGTRLAIFLGSALVLQDVWDPASAAELMAAERCGYTHASTTFAQDLLESPAIGRHDMSALRYFVSGGAAIPPGFAARMQERLGCTLLRLYGQTEAFMTTLNRPDDAEAILDSRDGRAVPGVELAVWDEAGEPCPPGRPGELACRGPHRCRGFYRDPERTAAAIGEDGWMRMGDLGQLDDDGYVQILGRAKDVISRGGYKFSPREVEDLLAGHPRVLRVALVRIPDRRLGERACACVIPRGDAALDLSDLTSYLRELGLAPYKLPERLEVMREFPTTPSGKVQKYVLEERLANSVGRA